MSDAALASLDTQPQVLPFDPEAMPTPKRPSGSTGRKKPEGSGRRKGSKNKRNQQVAEMLAELKCHPAVGLARIAQNKKNPVEVRAKCYSDLMKYVHPQLRATEVTGAGGGPLGLTLVDFLNALPDE